MTLQRALLPCLTLFLIAGQLAADPLPTDSRNTTGTLSNGLRYVYRQHNNPPGRMHMAVHVRSGSLNETDDQRGLAHFIEHMAFNGSENFAPGELVPFFERIGMRFGNDINAYTGYDQTVYLLFLPNAEDKQLDEGLMLLSDYVFRLSFLPEEIDKERGVILEEKRMGTGPQRRLRDALFERLFAGTLFGERTPIGVEEVIKQADRTRFLDYYSTWYRPENMTLVVVGDADFETVKPYIEKWFGAYTPDGSGRAPASAGLKPFTKQQAIVLTDPEYTSCEIEMMSLTPGRPAPQTVAEWRDSLVEGVASWIVQRRLEDQRKRGEGHYQLSDIGVSRFFEEAMIGYGSLQGEPGDWEKMVEELAVEISRARQYGLTEAELELARKQFIADAKRAVETESTRNGEGMMRGMVEQVNDRERIMSAQQVLDLYEALLPTIKVEELDAAFAKYFVPETLAFVLRMQEKEGVVVPSEDTLLAAARAAFARKVEPLKDKGVTTNLLAAEPKPGKVVESTLDEDLGVTSVWLDNNVRVHHRYMDYKKDTVMARIVLAGGRIEETPANYGVSEFASVAFTQPATSRLTSTEISDFMTGKKISVSGSMPMRLRDTFELSISGSPAELEDGLRLAHALITDGVLEKSAFDTWMQGRLQIIEAGKMNPMICGSEALMDVISGGDLRYVPPTEEIVKKQTLEAAQSWLKRISETAPIEVAVVGDIKLEDAMPLVEKYLGSLSKRPHGAEGLEPLRTLKRAVGPLAKRVDVETMTPQAVVYYGFIGADQAAVDESRQLSMASNILDSRLVKAIREEKGLAYAVQCFSVPSREYRDLGLFAAGAPCGPENVDAVFAAMEEVFSDFAKSGPTEEELENARKQVLNELDKALKEPSYWVGILGELELHKLSLEKLKTIEADYKGYTLDQVMTAFRKYYTPERTFQVSAAAKVTEPEAPVETEAAEPTLAQ